MKLNMKDVKYHINKKNAFDVMKTLEKLQIDIPNEYDKAMNSLNMALALCKRNTIILKSNEMLMSKITDKKIELWFLLFSVIIIF